MMSVGAQNSPQEATTGEVDIAVAEVLLTEEVEAQVSTRVVVLMTSVLQSQ